MCPVGVTGKLSKGDPKGIPDICPGRHVYNVVKHLSRGGSVDLSRGINYMFNAVLGVCVCGGVWIQCSISRGLWACMHCPGWMYLRSCFPWGCMIIKWYSPLSLGNHCGLPAFN